MNKVIIEIIADKIAMLAAALLTVFALFKGWKEWVEAKVKIAKESSSGETAIKDLKDAVKKIQDEIEWLKKNQTDNTHQIDILENDFKDIMMRIMDFHFKQ